jgi:hypothetical protein
MILSAKDEFNGTMQRLVGQPTGKTTTYSMR